MTSLLVTGTGIPACGLPVARVADPDEYEAPLLVVTDRHGDTAAVAARGEVDMLTVTQLRDALDDCLAADVRTVVADLRHVTFVDCAGVGELAAARRRADRRGVTLDIRAGRAVTRVAALLGMTAVLGL